MSYENTKHYTIIAVFRGHYDGLAFREVQYSPSSGGDVNIVFNSSRVAKSLYCSIDRKAAIFFNYMVQ